VDQQDVLAAAARPLPDVEADAVDLDGPRSAPGTRRAYRRVRRTAYAPRSTVRKEAAVYGTLGRMTPKAGKRDELIALMSAPPGGAAANGYRGGYLLKADEGDDVVVAVMYDDKDAYFAMVHDPQTDENFGKIMELLEGEPAWTDGEWLGTGA
jgi:hypothetical protein